MEIVNVIEIGADFGREELGIESRCFGPRNAVQPSPLREGERFSFLRLLLGDGLRLRVYGGLASDVGTDQSMLTSIGIARPGYVAAERVRGLLLSEDAELRAGDHGQATADAPRAQSGPPFGFLKLTGDFTV